MPPQVTNPPVMAAANALKTEGVMFILNLRCFRQQNEQQDCLKGKDDRVGQCDAGCPHADGKAVIRWSGRGQH